MFRYGLIRDMAVMALGIMISAPGVAGGAHMSDAARDPGSRCVGRFVIDLGGAADVAVTARYRRVKTEREPPSRDFNALASTIKHRADTLENAGASKRDPAKDRLYRRAGFDPEKLYGKGRLAEFKTDEANGRVLLGYRPETRSPRTRVELHVLSDGHQYLFTSNAESMQEFPTMRDEVWSAAQRFRVLRDNQLPDTPGFCIDGGVFSDDGKPPVREKFTLVAHFKDHPDATFTVDSQSIARADDAEPSLRHRVDGELRMLQSNVDGPVNVLRRGDREAAGQSGYEVAVSIPDAAAQGRTAYKFFWSAEGVSENAVKPFMEVELMIQPDDDHPVSVKSVDAAVAMWNALLDGIRVRPGAISAR